MCYFSWKAQKLPFLAVLTWFLILGKIQDGRHCWWRHRPPAVPPPLKYTSDQRLSTKGKIVSKYSNISNFLLIITETETVSGNWKEPDQFNNIITRWFYFLSELNLNLFRAEQIIDAVSAWYKEGKYCTHWLQRETFWARFLQSWEHDNRFLHLKKEAEL